MANSQMEYYEGIKEIKLEWGEDLHFAPHKYCPLCGKRFKVGDTVVIIPIQPVVKYFDDPEMDSGEIWLHADCIRRKLK